ncbi:MAG: hemin uptake protein HemP [Bacillota bacterium]
MPEPSRQQTQSASTGPYADSTGTPAIRIKSEELFRQAREVEIDHQGRIYRLRLTQLNKLILTA